MSSENYKRSSYDSMIKTQLSLPNSIYLSSNLIKSLPTARKTWKILNSISQRLFVYRTINERLYVKDNLTLEHPDELGLFIFFTHEAVVRFEQTIMSEIEEYLKSIEQQPEEQVVEDDELKVQPFETGLTKRK